QGGVLPAWRTPARRPGRRRGPGGGRGPGRRGGPQCGRRFHHLERRDPEPAYVIKRDGETQRFDRTKLRAALLAAAHKRPVTAVDVETIVDRIEVAAGDSGELSTERIGELCLTELGAIDRGAYLQF